MGLFIRKKSSGVQHGVSLLVFSFKLWSPTLQLQWTSSELVEVLHDECKPGFPSVVSGHVFVNGVFVVMFC